MKNCWQWYSFFLITIFGLLVACAPPTTEPAGPTFPVESTTESEMLGCAEGGAGVFTPEDVRCYLNSFSPEFVWEIDEETAVLFTDPDSIADWVGGAIIYHVPTVSSLVLDRHGEIDPQFSHINDHTAQLAYDRLTADASTMAEIKPPLAVEGVTIMLSAPLRR